MDMSVHVKNTEPFIPKVQTHTALGHSEKKLVYEEEREAGQAVMGVERVEGWLLGLGEVWAGVEQRITFPLSLCSLSRNQTGTDCRLSSLML